MKGRQLLCGFTWHHVLLLNVSPVCNESRQWRNAPSPPVETQIEKKTWSLNQIQLIWTQFSLSFDASVLHKVRLQDVGCMIIFPNHNGNRISKLDRLDE